MANTTATDGGGDTTDSTTTDTTSDSTTSDGGSLPTVLSSFALNPRGFILGAVLTAILEGIFGIVTEILGIIQLLFFGTDPASASPTEAAYGIADLPIVAANLVIGAFGAAGDGILSAIRAFNQPLFDIAASAGAAAPVIIAAFVVAETIVVLIVVERLIRILIDAIPGGGGLL